MELEWIDKKILKYLDYNDGFFIEVGANDGIRQSNTYHLAKQMGWRGILIEPSYNTYLSCKELRKESKCFNCALVSSDFKEPYITGDFSGNLMSSVDGKRLKSDFKVKVTARTLTSILDECKPDKIDFFSLDVEGYELEVLKGLDFSKYSPKYVLIEIYEWDKENINNFMISNGYELICNLSGFNLENNPYWDGTHNDYLFRKL